MNFACLNDRSSARVGLEPGNLIYRIKKRSDPRMQEKETLARQGNVVVRAGSTEQASSRRV